MRKITILLSVITALVIVACTTRKDKNCPDYLLYRLPATLYPANDTFNIGDTIWLEMNFNQDMLDDMGNVENSFVDYDFNMSFQCARIDTDPPIPKTVDFFKLYSFIGKDSALILGNSGISEYKIFPAIMTKGYQLKFAAIPKQKGLFMFGIGPVERYGMPFLVKDNCTNVTVQIGVKLNNDNDDNNFHLLQFAAHSSYRNITKENFQKMGSYCIVVK